MKVKESNLKYHEDGSKQRTKQEQQDNENADQFVSGVFQ